MINLNGNVSSVLPNISNLVQQPGQSGGKSGEFAKTIKAVKKYVSQADELQRTSDTSIKDLLTGKNEDITAVVSAVAKADMSFKLLVGVRNKLIEAYKQTMNMQI